MKLSERENNKIFCRVNNSRVQNRTIQIIKCKHQVISTLFGRSRPNQTMFRKLKIY
jgi:hypothetical protein